jgi:hypothetical protein
LINARRQEAVVGLRPSFLAQDAGANLGHPSLSYDSAGSLATFGNKGVAGDDKAGRTVRVFGDPDPGCDQDFAGYKAVILNLQVGFARGKIGAVIPLPRHPEGLAQASGAGSQGGNFGRSHTSGPRHYLQAADRFQRPKQDAAGKTIRLAGDIQAKIHAVDEVDVGMPRGPKKNGVSRRFAGKRVRRRIGLAEVSFYLDNTSHHLPSYQQLTQKLLGHQVGRIQVKVPRNEGCFLTGSSHALL